MKMQRFVLAATAILSLSALAVSAQAQTPGEGGAGAGRQGRGGQGRNNPMVQALEKLNLTDDQKAKIKTLTEKMRADVMAIPQAERRTKMREINQKFQDDVRAVLTPEQQKQLKEETDKLRAAGPGAGGPGAGAMNPLDNITEQLTLTEEQKTKIDPIKKSTTEELTKLRDDQSTEQREKMQKMVGIIDNFKAKIRPLLTTEQQTKLDSIRGIGGGAGRGGAGGGQRRGGGNRGAGGAGNGGIQ